LLDKAGKALSAAAEKTGVPAFLADQLAKQSVVAEKLQKATGFDTVMKSAENLVNTGVNKLETAIRNTVHGPDNPLRAENVAALAAQAKADPALAVQLQMNKSMQEAGNPNFKLTAAEGAILAKELAKVRPGDHLVVEKSGEIYLSLAQPGQKQPDAPKSAVVLDADALREHSGIARAPELAQAPKQAAQEAAAPQAQMVASM
jgi:hypothetical protein